MEDLGSMWDYEEVGSFYSFDKFFPLFVSSSGPCLVWHLSLLLFCFVYYEKL
jgi:hypothetical protein